jgi:hypothetical protein
MGMDVVGKKPHDEKGEYFRASIWEWRPIHELIRGLCADLFDEEALLCLAFNDGSGPADQETCSEMAKRFSTWLKGFDGDKYFVEDSSLRVTRDGRLISGSEMLRDPELVTESAYSVDREMLAGWIQFLDRCGGFEVW